VKACEKCEGRFRPKTSGQRFCSLSCSNSWKRGVRSGPKPTKGAVVADIRRVARELGHFPTTTEYRDRGEFSDAVARGMFGGTWKSAIEGAGLRYEYRSHLQMVSDKELARDIRRVAEICGRPPNSRDYKKHGKYAPRTYVRRAGGRNGRWGDVLRRYFGAAQPEAQGAVAKSPMGNRREELFADVRRVALLLGHFPSTNEYNKHGHFKYRSVMYYFRPEGGLKRYGSWADVRRALEADAPRVVEMSGVIDPVRDKLKSESVAAITEFFRKRQGVDAAGE
jgi:hypothetical protein